MRNVGKLALPLPVMQNQVGGFRDLARSSMFGAGLSGLILSHKIINDRYFDKKSCNHYGLRKWSMCRLRRNQ